MDHRAGGRGVRRALTGAAIGLVLSAALCWGLYRRVLKINLTRFFTATGVVLIVIAAGVLGYGLRDLQEGGVLPGKAAYAVDLSGSVDGSSWYSTLVQGVFNVTPAMTWLQVVGYVGYLAVVMTLFVRGARAAAPKPAAEKPSPAPDAPRSARRRPAWVVPVAVVTVPAVIAGLAVAFGRPKPAAAQTIAVSGKECGKGFSAPKPGRQTFQMHNTGGKTSEVYLVDPATGAVYGEVEGLAPAPPAHWSPPSRAAPTRGDASPPAAPRSPPRPSASPAADRRRPSSPSPQKISQARSSSTRRM